MASPTRRSPIDELRFVRSRLIDAERELLNVESEITNARVAHARAILARAEASLLRLISRFDER